MDRRSLLQAILSKTGRLPAGYTELEYIESTGTQYIDTGIKTNSNNGYEIKFSFNQIRGYDRILGGSYGKDTLFYISNNQYAQFYSTINYFNYTTTLNTEYTAKMDIITKKIYMNNTEVASLTNKTFSTDINILLCSAQSSDRNLIGRIYYAKLNELGTLVRDFIPAKRNSDNEIGMYDLVSNTFFTNQGTGSFIGG